MVKTLLHKILKRHESFLLSMVTRILDFNEYNVEIERYCYKKARLDLKCFTERFNLSLILIFFGRGNRDPPKEREPFKIAEEKPIGWLHRSSRGTPPNTSKTVCNQLMFLGITQCVCEICGPKRTLKKRANMKSALQYQHNFPFLSYLCKKTLPNWKPFGTNWVSK